MLATMWMWSLQHVSQCIITKLITISVISGTSTGMMAGISWSLIMQIVWITVALVVEDEEIIYEIKQRAMWKKEIL